MKLSTEARHDMFSIAQSIKQVSGGIGGLFQNEMDMTADDVDMELAGIRNIEKYLTAYREECERLKTFL